MNARIARLVSVSLFGIYIFLAGTGLYAQWYTGNYLFEPFVNFEVLVGGGLSLAVWAAIGALLIWHFPGNSIGWLVILFPLSWALDQFTWGYYQISLVSDSGFPTASTAALIWQNWSDYPASIFFLSLLFLLFPTGRPYPPQTRRVAWVGILVYVLYILSETIKPGPIFTQVFEEIPINPLGTSQPVWRLVQPLNAIFLLSSVVFLVFTVGSLVLRMKLSAVDERQQIKWFAYFAVIDVILVVVVLVLERTAALPAYARVIGFPVVLASMGMAVAIAIAIFRYRLYAIDIIIRRTLVYGTLTGFLAIIYFTSVILIQGLLTAAGSPRTAAATVLSTLLIAALFSPLRKRLQVAIDRRFYRKKYDMEKALSDFGIQVRDEVDVEKLSDGLLRIVDDALRPEHASLWLIDPVQSVWLDRDESWSPIRKPPDRQRYNNDSARGLDP